MAAEITSSSSREIIAFAKNYKNKMNMLDSILDITIVTRRPSGTKTTDSSELVFKRNISDVGVERCLRANGVND